MKTYRFTVPPTRQQGSHAGTCRGTSGPFGETYRQNALWDYNRARAHDGLPPVSRMPAGTAFIPQGPVCYIQRKGDGYLETVDQFDTWKEGRAMLAEYRMADPSAHHYLSRRPCKDWAER